MLLDSVVQEFLFSSLSLKWFSVLRFALVKKRQKAIVNFTLDRTQMLFI